jgi:two-component system cell cycle response regulator
MARIVVIEDNGPNLELMTYLLEAHSHGVAGARDGEEGLAQIRREPPDAIVCDIHLPRMDGYEVARQLKSDAGLRKVPLIAVTALAMVGDREKVLAAGFDGYIGKPIEPESFVAQVEAFLATELRTGAAAVPTGHVNAATSPSPEKHVTVLVIDDSSTNRDLLESVLGPHGYRVIAANSVKQALELARSAAPDLFICDMRMPVADGFEMLRSVKTEPLLSGKPFVFLSGSVSEARELAEGLRLGADHFILKPVEPEKLLAVVDSLVGRRTQARSRGV